MLVPDSRSVPAQTSRSFFTRQIERARAYAARKGSTVADEHVYTDDGISGAELTQAIILGGNLEPLMAEMRRLEALYRR